MLVEVVGLGPGANPTTLIYNASIVKFYSATGSLARFENKKNILFCFEKRSSLQQRWRCGCQFKSRRIGSCNNIDSTAPASGTENPGSNPARVLGFQGKHSNSVV
jgi:hypothetical protein